jgi:hypothetical protein
MKVIIQQAISKRVGNGRNVFGVQFEEVTKVAIFNKEVLPVDARL